MAPNALTEKHIKYIKEHMSTTPCFRCGENHACHDCKIIKPPTLATWFAKLPTDKHRKETNQLIEKFKGEFIIEENTGGNAGTTPREPTSTSTSQAGLTASLSGLGLGNAWGTTNITKLPAAPRVTSTFPLGHSPSIRQPNDPLNVTSELMQTTSSSLRQRGVSPVGSKNINATEGAIRRVKLQDLPKTQFTRPNNVLKVPKETSYAPGNEFRPSRDIPSRSPDDSQYPPRDSYRTRVDQAVLTNYFEVAFTPRTVFYEYQIIDLPEPVPKSVTERIMRTIIDKVAFLRDNQGKFATDNINKIISWKNLHDKIPTSSSTHGQESVWDLVGVEDGPTIWWPRIKYVREIDDGLLTRVTQSGLGTSLSDINSVKEALNIVISKNFQGNIVRTSKNKFFCTDTWSPLGNSHCPSLAALRGYSYTFKLAREKMMLNVNSSTSAFWQPGLVIDVLRDNDMPNHNLKGVRVLINYERGRDEESKKSGINDYHARIKTICGFGGPCDQQTFMFKGDNEREKRPWTIEEYMRVHYYKLKSPKFLAVNCGSTLSPTWYAPECLEILPFQTYRKTVPDNLSATMVKLACRSPTTNRALIEHEALSQNLFHDNNEAMSLSVFQRQTLPPVSLTRQMLQISSARLEYPDIAYRHGQTQAKEQTGRWTLRGRKFLSDRPTDFCFKMIVQDKSVFKTIETTRDTYKEHFILQSIACGVGTPKHIGDTKTSSLDFNSLLCTIETMMCPNDDGEVPDLIILLLQKKDQYIYSDFKYLTDRFFTVHSICLTEDSNIDRKTGKLNERNPLIQYFANVAMKANLKMGKINHTVKNLHDLLSRTMVLGADLTHPGPASLAGCPSIAAVVGSVDKTGGKFLGSIDFQEKSDLVSNFENMVSERFHDWHTHNNSWPENVLYYRDGVSDTQYNDVLEKEANLIEGALAKAVEGSGTRPPSSPIKVTVVIVTKRHNTRFFPSRHQDSMPKNENCKPGTLVENAVTSPYHMDFYLQSHNGIKGTAKAAHYFVLRNDMGLSSCQLQDMTHQLNYTYVRATLGVSYASPAYYADRLCERGRCYLRKWLSPDDDDRNEWDSKKLAFDEEVRAERIKTGKGPVQRKSGQRKSPEELQEDKKEREESRRRLEIWGDESIRSMLKACQAPDEKLAHIQQTMYWM